MNIIEIKNLNFSFDQKVLFDNLNLQIKEKTWNSLIGNNGSGKTTLLKIILGLIERQGIIIDDIVLNSDTKYEIRKKIGCVFENPNHNLICETVEEELAFPLENIGLESEEIDIRITQIIKLFNFIPDRKKEIISLNLDQKQILALMTALITSPKMLILDEAFTYMSPNVKNKILNILKKLDITVISVTHDMEELLLADNVILLQNEKAINVARKQIFDGKELKHFPFIVELSKKLQYYDLVEEISYSYKDLVDQIWK